MNVCFIDSDVISPAPAAAPTSMSISKTTSSSITLQWSTVECIHRNGDITGYSVQYTGGGSTQIRFASGYNVTLSNLMASTTYYMKVAAINSAGTGVYSEPTHQLTQGIYIVKKGGVHFCPALSAQT